MMAFPALPAPSRNLQNTRSDSEYKDSTSRVPSILLSDPMSNAVRGWIAEYLQNNKLKGSLYSANFTELLLSRSEAGNGPPANNNNKLEAGNVFQLTPEGAVPVTFGDRNTKNPNTAVWQTMSAVVQSWAALEMGWDGGDAIKPEKASLVALERFIRAAITYNSPIGELLITSDGEVGLTWDGPTEIATLSFLANGALLAFCPRSEKSFSFSGAWHEQGVYFDFIQALKALI